MKSKIALVILLLIILVLGGLDIFFGYKYSSQRNINTDMATQVDDLNAQITNLNSQIEELNRVNEEIQNSTESNETTNETQRLKIYSNNDTLLLYLIEDNSDNNIITNDNLPDSVKFIDALRRRRYILIWASPQSLFAEVTGYFIEENGTLKLNVIEDNGKCDKLTQNFGVTVEDTNSGSKNLVCSYNGESILFGNETFTLK